MMRQYELVERVTKYDPDADEDLLNRAYVYAMKAHGNQKRASGEAYFNHPLEVAAILTDMKLDSATIAAALLHDTVEDTDATHQEIEEKFGPEIAALVDGLTKIAKLDLVTKEATQAENLRKLLLAMSRDVRVLLVKLADRLHNMRTLEHVKPEKRIRIAQETMDIYAPLAGRMGMQAVRDELEDIAFRVLNPEANKIILDRLARLHAESGGILKSIEEELPRSSPRTASRPRCIGREKRPYSIWRKMERKHLSLGQLSDIFGFRVIVGTVDQCYRALGIVHRTCRAVPGRFKDYISTPKQNDYRSIHTTVIGPHHMRVEMQIRTRLMHEIAERGVAAHAIYKDAPEAKEALDGFKGPPPNPMPTAGSAISSRCCRRATAPRSSWSTPGSNCSTTRCSASRPRASSSRCRRAPRPSTSPMRCTPRSATAAWAPRSTAATRRWSPNWRTATRWTSSAPRRRRRPPPGRASP